MKFNKCKSALTAIGLGLALSAGSVSAAVTFFSPITKLHDDNIDFVVDTDGSGTITVGDRLISVAEFNNSEGIFAGQGPAPFTPHELTLVADITVAAIIPQGLNSRLVFTASGAAGVLAGFAPGTTAAIWLDATPDLSVTNANCGTRAACMALAGLGGGDGSALWATIGFGDADDLWISDPTPAGFSIAAVQAGGASSSFGTFNFSQSLLVNNTGRNFSQQPCDPFCSGLGDGLVDVTGNGQILGGQGLIAAEWTARSKTDAQVFPLPEPGSLALLAAGLFGLAFGFRKKA